MVSVQNAQKTHLARSLNQFADKKVGQAIQILGKSLPCSVSAIPTAGVPIVTVKFEVNAAPWTLPNVTVPMFGPEYLRYPIQVGCKGVVFPVDAYVGGVSGLGGGTADLSQRGNLSTLVFFPIANKGWTASEAPNKAVLYGPDGVVLRDAGSKTVITIDKTDGVTITVQAAAHVTVNGNGIVNGNWQVNGDLGITGTLTWPHGSIDGTSGNMTLTGDLAATGAVVAGSGGADQVGLQTHTHTQPNDSHGDVEGATNAPTAGT